MNNRRLVQLCWACVGCALLSVLLAAFQAVKVDAYTTERARRDAEIARKLDEVVKLLDVKADAADLRKAAEDLREMAEQLRTP